MFFKITFKFAHLMRIELWLCSGIVVIYQRLETALLITLEIVAGGTSSRQREESELPELPTIPWIKQ